MKTKIDIADIQHPYRQAAASILDLLINEGWFKTAPKNEDWYRLEDELTNMINGAK